jgi:hypothetical protein
MKQANDCMIDIRIGAENRDSPLANREERENEPGNGQRTE